MEAGRSLTAGYFGKPRPLAMMTAYERFERVLAPMLSFIIAAVIVLTVFRWSFAYYAANRWWSGHLQVWGVSSAVRHGHDTPDAMEFKHSIIRAALRQESVVQVKTVILIALLALSRKFIILDTAATKAPTMGLLQCHYVLGLCIGYCGA